MKYGIVKDINDPELLGRVKVNVYNHHNAIATKDLPWSIVVSPSTSPAISGKGHSTNFLVGTLVVGFFTDNTMQDFIVMGSLPTTTEGIKDNNVRVRGEPDPNAGETVGAMQPPTQYGPQYPFNNVYESESGHVKEYDDTPGKERINERHKSGTHSTVEPNGTKVEKIVRDRYTLIIHDDTLEVHGTVNIITSENCNLSVAGYVTANVGGNIDVKSNADVLITAESNITLKATNIDKKITLDGDVDVTGNVVVTGTTTTSENLILDSHVHTQPNDSDGDGQSETNTPINS